MSPEDRTFYLGTSGWSHRDWVGRLYPPEMPAAEYLAAYAQHFSTVEIEHTFFATPLRETIRAWRRRTPEGFLFCPCLPRQITHVQRLRQAQALVDAFYTTIAELEDKLGPVLIQLPEDFRRTERAHLETFLQQLPRQGQFAVEFRHGSWLKDDTWHLLEAYQVAWVTVDAAFLPRLPRVTAPFAYVRWHGHPGLGAQSTRQLDPGATLRPWVPILRDLARQAPRVFGYVRNSFSGYAPRDCQTLAALLGEP